MSDSPDHSQVAQSVVRPSVKRDVSMFKPSPGNYEQTYAIRLPDGTEVEWSKEQLAAYEGDWHVNLTIEQSETLYNDIMGDIA